MRGWNRRIISALGNAATNTLGHSPSNNAAHNIINVIQSQKVVSRFHSFAFPSQSSTLLGLRQQSDHNHNHNHNLALQKFFSTNPAAVGPRSSTIIARKHAGNGSGGSSNHTSWARYLLALPPVLCAGLCKWQLDRRQWKIDLLERRKRIMKGEPVDIFSDDISYPEEYQRVIATGIFDHSRTQYIGPRPRSRMGTTEAGYLAVTPLIYNENNTAASKNSRNNKIFWKNSSQNGNGGSRKEVLVLRGWVPKSWRPTADSTAGTAAAASSQSQHTSSSTSSSSVKNDSIVTIQGVVRFGEDPGTFVPENKPQEGTWFYLNSEELADAVGLPRGTPLIEVISTDEDVKMLDSGPTVLDVLGGRGKLPSAPVENYPLAKSEGDMGAFSVMPRDHMNYAITWFTLMVATGGMAFKALKRRSPR